MPFRSYIRSLFRNLSGSRRLDQDLDEEVSSYTDLLVEEKMKQGMQREDARRAARLEMGGDSQVKEEVRRARAGAWLHTWWQDVRYGARVLRKNPGFTAIAALSLALGIGANTATFSMADALLLRPLPVTDPSHLLMLTTAAPADQFAGGMSYPDYRDLSSKTTTFEGLIAAQGFAFSVAKSGNEIPRMRGGFAVSDNFFSVLGVQPVLGRGFLAEEGQVSGRNPVVVLSYQYWRTEYAGDPSVIHQQMLINGIEFNIVGVAPESFTGIDPYLRPPFFVPAAMLQRLNGTKDDPLADRSGTAFDVKGRVKPGVSTARAQAEMTTLWRDLKHQYPETDRGRVLAVSSELQGRIRRNPIDAGLIATLLALVAAVLLIACANVANLMLSRARGRAREIALRLALGVRRLRLLRQLLVESMLLALVGGVVGVGFAFAGIRFLQTFPVPTDLPIVISPQLDLRVLIYSLVVTLVSAIAFGLAPAWQSMKVNLIPALKNAETAGRTRMLGKNTLVVVQVGFAMVLLIASGMMLSGFRHSLILGPGFRTDHLMTLEFDTTLVRYTPAQSNEFFHNLIDQTRALPGVRSATLMESAPFSPSVGSYNVAPEGYQFARGTDSASVFGAAVDEKFFDVMKLGIVSGRAFTKNDKEGSPPVAIVNQKFAEMYWPSADAIGKRLRLANNKDKSRWIEVVGVAKTAKYLFLSEPPTAFIYFPFAQSTTQGMVLAAESYGDPESVDAPIREIVHRLDGNMPAFNVRPYGELYQQRAVVLPGMIVETVGAMCLIGLTLALVGLYGLVAYSVARRTREIGVRIALGANQWQVLRMVLGQGSILGLSGIALGSVLSVAAAKGLAAGLLGLARPSIATYVLVPVILLLVTLASSYIPARRASTIDPVRALRYE